MPKEPTPLRIDELDVPALSAEAARLRSWLDAEDLVAAARTSSGAQIRFSNLEVGR